MYLAQPLRAAGLPNRALWQQKSPLGKGLFDGAGS